MAKAKRAPEPTGYNGWSNYETWAVNLWLENEEPRYRYWREAGKEARAAHGVRKGQGPGSRAFQDAQRALETRLKEEVADSAPELEGMWADLMNAAISDVDWYEIAEHFLTE